MRSLIPAFLFVLCTTALAQPPEQKDTTLHVPGVVTSSGKAFVAQCDDNAFSASEAPEALATRCARLLGKWRAEARLTGVRRHNPLAQGAYPVADHRGAELPFDTVATLREAPLTASYGVGSR
ncbi:hypothetical protein [Pseudoxanthomonas sp. JBR18]|uniref:hypothetical protein n=1 Tax=Pseudoxanthomonas sp. JBR18 TaxID=2969308 RepID=UPI0023063AD8|nr:hypothetical protein [Pseudoxanthomonas sp. JBR18]WCE05505.1 hypothetical protein PJ250_05970 [Pseudoxanthomonas sp. JBR18]